MSSESSSRSIAVLLAASMALPLLLGGLPQAAALPKSSNVAFLGSPGDELSINGGGLHTSALEYTQFNFSYVAPSSITSATSLAGIDTVILNMASGSFQCSSANIPTMTKIALVQWVQQGGKLVFYDSECSPGVDYAWLDFPFTTNNPGAQGATGTLRIIEENALSCSDPSLACYINASAVATQTDAVGDSNVFVSYDLNWCADMESDNANGVTGYSHAYALDGNGIYIYDGFDQDGAGYSPGTADGSSNLNKILLLELLQKWAPADLPCSVPVACSYLPPQANVAITRPAMGFDYVDDVAYAQSPIANAPRVVGALTLQATPDPGSVSSVTFLVDGAVVGTATAPPYQAVWTPGPAPAGEHVLSVRYKETAAPGCTHETLRLFEVPEFAVAGRATSLFAGTNAPVANEIYNDGAGLSSTSAPSGAESRVADRVLDAPFDGRVIAMDDTASSTLTGSAWDVATSSQVGHVDLFGGAIVADAIRADAHVAWDSLARAGTGSADTRFVNLRVNGIPIADPVPAGTSIPIPGVGTVTLNEQHTQVASVGARAYVDAIHVHVAQNGFQAELIVGQAFAAASPLASAGESPRLIVDERDDAGTGGDAADTFLTATPLTMQAPDGSGHVTLAGRIDAVTDLDFYAVRVKPGQEIVARLVPAAETFEKVGEVRSTSDLGDTGAGLRNLPDLRLALLEPGSGRERDDSLRYLGNLEVGLDVDVEGAWVLVVEPLSIAVGNYTLDVTVRDLALLPGDGTGLVDAGSDCASALPMGGPQVAGVMQGTDFVDVWSLPAVTGDKLAATMKPGDDADGANFDLVLLDGSCLPLSQSTLGNGDGLPKGTAEAVVDLPVRVTGTYYLKVVRVNGIGDYALTATAQHVIADAPANDALSGQDAPPSCLAPMALPAPAGLYEGTLAEGDYSDAYSIHVNAGDRVVVTVMGETLSDMVASWYGPGCAYQGGAYVGEIPATFSLNPAPVSGDYVLVLSRSVAGGNYVIGVA